MLQQLLLNGIIAGSIYSLVALGFALNYQTTRFPARTMAGRFSAFVYRFPTRRMSGQVGGQPLRLLR